MTEALRNKRRNQSQSGAIIRHQAQSGAIRRNQASIPAAHSNWAQSVAISRNQASMPAAHSNWAQSVAISRNQASMPAAHSNWASRREIVARRRSRVRGPLPLRAARRTARRGFRSRSEAIRGHHRQSEVIRGHQRPSEAIRGPHLRDDDLEPVAHQMTFLELGAVPGWLVGGGDPSIRARALPQHRRDLRRRLGRAQLLG